MSDEELAAYVDAAAAAMDLPIAPEYRPGVLRYFALAAAMADLVNAHPLGRDDDPAPAFFPLGATGDDT